MLEYSLQLHTTNLQLSADPAWPLRMWTNEMTYKLLEKVQRRKQMLLDPKLRRRMVYADVAQEFQVIAWLQIEIGIFIDTLLKALLFLIRKK